MNLSMTRNDLKDFTHYHKEAMMLINQATEEYISSRCLLLNGFFPGLTLAAQSVEKYLKGYLLLNDSSINVKTLGHKHQKLLNQAKQYTPDWDKYDDLATRLFGHYQSRYPDNPDGSRLMYTGELAEIDEFILNIIEKLPMPTEVKYRSGLYVQISHQANERFIWATKDNNAINIQTITTYNQIVMKHLYGNR